MITPSGADAASARPGDWYMRRAVAKSQIAFRALIKGTRGVMNVTPGFLYRRASEPKSRDELAYLGPPNL